MTPTLRFGVRDVFWLLLVVGLILGWILDHRRMAWENDRLRFLSELASPGFFRQLEEFLVKEGFEFIWNGRDNMEITSPSGRSMSQSVSEPVY